MTDGLTPEFEEIDIEYLWEDDSTDYRRVPPTKPEHPNVATLVQTVFTEGQNLVTSQVQLLKLKVQATGKKLGIGIAMMAVGAILAFYLIWWVFHTIELGIAHALPDWAASLIVAGILLLLIAILVVVGMKMAKKASEEKPDVQGFQTDIEVVKDALKEGKSK